MIFNKWIDEVWMDKCVQAQDMDDYLDLFHTAQGYVYEHDCKDMVPLKKVEKILEDKEKQYKRLSEKYMNSIHKYDKKYGDEFRGAHTVILNIIKEIKKVKGK